MKTVDKVVAYIVTGERLVVFVHRDVPEAGTQVPAGTVRPGERLEDAVLREAGEETGLEGLRIVAHIGDRVFDARPFGKEEMHRRSFFRLNVDGEVPDTWTHAELHDGLAPPTWFEFSWMPLAAAEQILVADQGALIGSLRGL